MDGMQANGKVDPVRESVIRRRRKWSTREKVQIVQEALRPGAVLQGVAQRHGLHPSLLTRWRAQHRAAAKKVIGREARLIPVEVERGTRPRNRFVQSVGVSENSSKLGAIEVEFSSGRRLCIQGVVDAGMLSTVLQELSRS
jgi:transposase-like protein